MSQAIVPLQILKSLSDAIAELVGKVAPSVVSVSSVMHGHRGRGTGVIWNNDGHIVTCSHVIGRPDAVKIGLVDGGSFDAKVVGQDPYSDVALLKIKGNSFKPIELGDSENLKVGQFVITLAKPFRIQPGATSGTITSVGVSLRSWRGMTMESLIVTDARLNPGYSGGPLVDVSGRMIGLNTAYIWSRGIAVPINAVKDIAERLAREGKVKRAYLGVTSSTIPLPQDIATQAEVKQDGGVIVLSVETNSPAKKAGLTLGDIIVKFDEKPVTSVYDLPRLLTEEAIGKETKLSILRGEKLKELTITPKARE